MALPVRKSNESLFEFQFNDAAIIGKSTLKEWAKLFDISSKENSTRNFKRRDSSHWQEKAFGVSEGGRNSSLASILGHLFNRRVNEHIIFAFAQMWGQSCTPPMSEREINATFYSIMKNTITTREEFSMNFTNDEIMNEINENLNKRLYTPDFIPDGYKVKSNNYGAALYQIIPSKKMVNQIKKNSSLLLFQKSILDMKILKMVKLVIICTL